MIDEKTSDDDELRRKLLERMGGVGDEGVSDIPKVPAVTTAGTAGDDFSNQIRAEYQKVGRTASQAEIDSHRANPGGVAAVAAMLARGAGGNDAATQQATQVGHDGTTAGGKTREQYRDAWMSSGVKDLAGLKAWLAQNGGTLVNDNGTVMTPYGEQLDLLIGAKTGNGQAGWTASAGMTGASSGLASAGATGTAGTTAGTGAAATTAGTAAAAAPSTTSAFQESLRQMLKDRIEKASLPVDDNTAGIKQPYDAAKLSVSRSQDEERKALAERAYAQGSLNSDALGQSIQQSSERNAVGLAGIKADLYTRQLTAQREELNTAMQQALAMGDAEQARSLQLQIATMTTELQKYGIDTSAATQKYGIDSSATTARQGLTQNQSQFDDTFGLTLSNTDYQRGLDAARAAAGLPF